MATIMIKIMANIRIEIESQLISGMPAYLRARTPIPYNQSTIYLTPLFYQPYSGEVPSE